MKIKLSELRVGDVVVPDGGFDCMCGGEDHPVYSDGNELYVVCAAGRHYLEPQTGKRGYLIGFTKGAKDETS